MTADLWAELPVAIQKIRNSKGESLLLKRFDAPCDARNEAVFFLKPELTSDRNVHLKAVCSEIREHMRRFDVDVCACAIFNGKYLDEHDIMAAHYGTINNVSCNGIEALGEAARSKLSTEFGSHIARGAVVLGGHQVLEKFNDLNKESLSTLWDERNANSIKLGPGVYAILFTFHGNDVVVLNGFHPFQLSYYTNDSRCIAVMVTRATTPWSILRSQFIGATDPAVAATGSIRSDLLRKKESFGIAEINKGLNGVHLSAGPIEAYFELLRFFGNNEEVQMHSNFLWVARQSGCSIDKLNKAAYNPLINCEGNIKSIFDTSEDLDIIDGVKLLEMIND